MQIPVLIKTKYVKALDCFLGSFYQGGRLDEATDITDILNAPLLL